jgi:hypothetical protein
MKKLLILSVFAALMLTGCPLIFDDDYDFEYDTIIPDTPVNLEKLNSAYDDYNSDLPYRSGRSDLYFSTSRNSAGDNFDIIIKYIDISYHERDDALDFHFPGDSYSAFTGKLFPLINTEANELGPYMFSGETSRDYFFYATNPAGKFDIKFVYTSWSDWGTYNAQQRIYGPFDVIPANSVYDDLYPAINKDKSRLIFCSNRENNQFDIYSFPVGTSVPLNEFLTDDSPVAVTKETVLSGSSDDKCPSINGNLMVFTSDRAGGYGGFDLYYSVYSNGAWGAPVNFGAAINSAEDEYRPIIFPFDATGIMIFSSDRPGGKGGFDLYAVRIDELVLNNQ